MLKLLSAVYEVDSTGGPFGGGFSSRRFGLYDCVTYTLRLATLGLAVDITSFGCRERSIKYVETVDVSGFDVMARARNRLSG